MQYVWKTGCPVAYRVAEPLLGGYAAKLYDCEGNCLTAKTFTTEEKAIKWATDLINRKNLKRRNKMNKIVSLMLLWWVTIGCGSDVTNCLSNAQMFCKNGVTYWADSCGNQGDISESCECGCNENYSSCEKDCGCTPDCTGKECGPDGCGVTCPPGCSGGDTCNEATGRCESQCNPICAGKECGSDGCGVTCPPGCSADEICNEATGNCATVCTPACNGRECGFDGCEGSCGTCSEGEHCFEFLGYCEDDCVPVCTDSYCELCPLGQMCEASGQCSDGIPTIQGYMLGDMISETWMDESNLSIIEKLQYRGGDQYTLHISINFLGRGETFTLIVYNMASLPSGQTLNLCALIILDDGSFSLRTNAGLYNLFYDPNIGNCQTTNATMYYNDLALDEPYTLEIEGYMTKDQGLNWDRFRTAISGKILLEE